MSRLAELIRVHGAAYLQRYGTSVLPSHAKAMNAIVRCRTLALGAHLASCSHCGDTHLLLHSCGHRSCPQCGHRAAARWLDRQRRLLLPVPYFHVVFTLPSELRRSVRSHQRILLPILFKAAFASLSTLCADHRHLGGRIGALAVLHTWTRTLEWHPHIHMLVPAGALTTGGDSWRRVPARGARFLVPVHALAEHFRGRFLHLARRALRSERLPLIPWNKRWVVFCKPAVRGPDKVLNYLARYVHRTALSDKAITHHDAQVVTFTYRNNQSQRRRMTLPIHEFLRRFLQHTPAKGLHRVRSFGLLHPRHRKTLRRLQLALSTSGSCVSRRRHQPLPEAQQLRCPSCGKHALRVVSRLSQVQCSQYLALILHKRPDLARAPPPQPYMALPMNR